MIGNGGRFLRRAGGGSVHDVPGLIVMAGDFFGGLAAGPLMAYRVAAQGASSSAGIRAALGAAAWDVAAVGSAALLSQATGADFFETANLTLFVNNLVRAAGPGGSRRSSARSDEATRRWRGILPGGKSSGPWRGRKRGKIREGSCPARRRSIWTRLD